MARFWGGLFAWVIRPFVALIVGRGVLAALHVLGVYPDKWLASVSEEVYEFAIWGVAATVGTGVLLVDWKFALSLRFLRDEFISALDAVKLVNDSLYETDWGGTIRGWTKDESVETAIAFAGRMLAGGIPLYGVPPAHTERKPIDTTSLEMQVGSRWSGELNAIWDRRGRVLFTDLAFKKRDVSRFIKSVLRENRKASTGRG